MFYVSASITYIFVYVPAADRIAAAINRSPFGLLLARFDRVGERVRAHEGHLQPRGTSPPCCISAFEATVPGSRPELSWAGSVWTTVSCYRRCVWIVGTQRTSRFVYWLYICRVIDFFMNVLLLCVYVCMYLS